MLLVPAADDLLDVLAHQRPIAWHRLDRKPRPEIPAIIRSFACGIEHHTAEVLPASLIVEPPIGPSLGYRAIAEPDSQDLVHVELPEVLESDPNDNEAVEDRVSRPLVDHRLAGFVDHR